MSSPDATATFENWIDPPFHRDGLRRVGNLVAVAEIASDPADVRELAVSGVPLDCDALELAAATGPAGAMEPSDDRISASAFLEQTATDAILILRGEEILYERYFGGNGPQVRHIIFSISKSFCGILAGTLVADDLLDPEAQTTAYVPELIGGAYDGSTVRQLLDMTARPHYSMDYQNPASEVHAGDRAAGWRPALPGDMIGNRAYLASVRGHEPHGTGFSYCSATTDVLAWVLERAGGSDYATLLSERLWAPMGAEANAYVTVDPRGDAYACAGMGMRLRDLARFGRLVLDGGMAGGRQVIPQAWISETAAGGSFETSDDPSRPEGTYRNQWWVTATHRPSFYGAGIFGQYLWLDPVRDVVIATFSSESMPRAHDAWRLAGYDALARAAGGGRSAQKRPDVGGSAPVS